MLKKNITSLLICAAILVATAPSKAYAQTPAQPAPADSGQSSSDAQAKAKPDLRAAFAEVTARTKSGTSPEADIKRFESKRLNAQSPGGYTRRQKILVTAIVVGLVVLAVVVAVKTGKGGRSICEDVPSDPSC